MSLLSADRTHDFFEYFFLNYIAVILYDYSVKRRTDDL